MQRAATLLVRSRGTQVSGLLGFVSREGGNEHCNRCAKLAGSLISATIAAGSLHGDDPLFTHESSLDSMSTLLRVVQWSNVNMMTSSCESYNNDDSFPYPEEEEFSRCLAYYRQQLPWYRKQWTNSDQNPISANWPRRIPTVDEISALEFDLKFCKRNCSHQDTLNTCDNLQFRICSFYLNSSDPNLQYKGYKLVKDLAERGHPDGMCLYGIVLNEGRVTHIDANPEQAVVWWQRCVDEHRHIPSLFELGVALYTGEGVAENPELAVKYFHKAANLHVGAAYMLGECLLDGLGIERRRAAALDWLIVAAELGHRRAQSRVLAILETDGPEYGAEVLSETTGKPASSQTDNNRRLDANLERRFTHGGASSLERRFTVGGGSRNPKIKERRKSIVNDSRADGTGKSSH